MLNEKRRMSPWTALFLGATAVIVATIASVSVVGVYGMNVGDRWAGQALNLVGRTVENLPQILESLPTALGDVAEYRRTPAYADSLAVDVRMAPDPYGGTRPVITVENRGTEVVTLLGLRVVGLDANGNPVGEWNEYAATPVMIDNELRGPLLPSRTRVFTAGGRFGQKSAAADVKWEITDVWIWPNQPEAEATTTALAGPGL